jgi:hypothetical protein
MSENAMMILNWDDELNELDKLTVNMMPRGLAVYTSGVWRCQQHENEQKTEPHVFQSCTHMQSCGSPRKQFVLALGATRSVQQIPTSHIAFLKLVTDAQCALRNTCFMSDLAVR